MKTKLLLPFLLLIGFSVLTACDDKDEPRSIYDLVGDEWIDPEFARALYENGYIKNSATVTPADVADITEINLPIGSLTSLRGIEYFSSLENLYCPYNNLTQLDLSKNTHLKVLYCYGNNLTQLNVSKNTQLELLWCNTNQLTKLDVSKNTQLKDLDCIDNQLTKLDVSKNTQLKELECGGNQLAQLDISKNTSLDIFRCHNNPGVNGKFRVKAWFNNSNIPSSFTGSDMDYPSSWTYNGSTVTIDYYK